MLLKKSFYINFIKQLLNRKIYYHLWYVYMIISIYLITPVLRKFVFWDREKNFQNTKYLISIWIFFLIFIPFLNTFLKLNIKIYEQVGEYAGYFLLGYLIGNKKITIFKNKKVSIILFFLFNIMIIYLTYIFTKKDGKLFEYFYDYHSIFVFLISIIIFEFALNFETKKKKELNKKVFGLEKFIKIVSAMTFDVYLMHPIFVFFCEKLLINKINYGK